MPQWVMVTGPIFIAAFCLGTLGMGLWLFLDALRFWCVAIRAVGKVVRLHSQWQEVNRSNDSSTWTERVMVYHPVSAFEDKEGVKHEVRANLGNICTPAYRVGEEVSILFTQDKPQSMRINSFSSLYGNAACLLFMASVGAMFLAFWLCYA